MPNPITCLPAILLSSLAAMPLTAQPAEFNYDEEKVPAYELPDALCLADGSPIEDAETWRKKGRPQTLELFREHVYGRSPAPPEILRIETLSIDRNALEGEAVRREVRVHLGDAEEAPTIDVLVWTPQAADDPAPVFLGLNFGGNHTVHADPGIRVTESWVRNDRSGIAVDHRADVKGRGAKKSRWDIEQVIDRGYALATAYYGDIDPDFHDGFENGVHRFFDEKAGPERAGDAWGSIAAWAWGLSRIVDWSEMDARIDHERIALLGHSRLGKTALWAGAEDERFALVISNNSGCGGAALNRRRFGETVERINTSFPHWFCDNFKKFNGAEDRLPIDQHQLIALIAPRPVYVASAVEDRWADPRGEFLAALGADPVYRLLETEAFPAKSQPALDRPVRGRIGYHIRSGGHDVKTQDWTWYLDFADLHLR